VEEDAVNEELQRIVAAKERRRRHLTALSFVEKIRTLVDMQTMAAPIEREKGRPARVWPKGMQKS
jgi:hypothetical protein